MASHSARGNTKKINPTDLEDDTNWEAHTILRVPSDVAPLIHQFIENGDQYDPSSRGNVQPGQMKLQMAFQGPSNRTGTLKVGDRQLNFVIQDLPTIVETYKTNDNINVYKVSDCTQIINCTVGDVNAPSEGDKTDPEGASGAEKRDKQLLCYHGLTPPMRNAHKRRFRKTKKMKYMDAPQVEQELKRLLRADLEADSVRWEIISSDPKPSSSKGKSESNESAPGPSNA